jgi:hypothetical protein
METEGSLPQSQYCPYPEPAWPSPYPHIPLPEDPSYYVLSSRFVINLHYFIKEKRWAYDICLVIDCPRAQPFNTEILNKFLLSSVWTLFH